MSGARGRVWGGAVLALLGLAAGLALQWRPVAEPIEVGVERPAGARPLPLLPASAASPASGITTARAPAQVASVAAPSDPAAKIGSEGYGPHVQRALDSGDAAQALEAANWIAQCKPEFDVEAALNGTHPKYRIQVADEVRAEWIERERLTQRLCQTLTPDLLAQHRALAQRAFEAKLPGAGLALYKTLPREERNESERALALRALRADAERGEALAVPVLALADLGLPRGEQLGYQRLLKQLVLRKILPAMNAAMRFDRPAPPFSVQEEDEASALAQRLLPRFRLGG
ncbi:hypothetical protein HNQ51_000028 [Inhella inkyongensis]|uniref:Uncharacterized protein n=1 Tax=Inhella inkyongensis TaxID=392593 RepID=A0A840RXS8_9BURK|nr:hypothetical protein [Inhella inkyongensis]MBB5202735.1 hypothetical protein [Inhella inkyongensis]